MPDLTTVSRLRRYVAFTRRQAWRGRGNRRLPAMYAELIAGWTRRIAALTGKVDPGRPRQ